VFGTLSLPKGNFNFFLFRFGSIALRSAGREN